MGHYVFINDTGRCIGCEACTVACKAENSVPLGVWRLRVKYVEKGLWPNTKKYFVQLRCNHCEAAPCVRACPVEALFKRPDGIVDLDQTRCIGCKACIAACPYDAIYINPMKGVAEKCNACAHLVDAGFQPACVQVCPTNAIIFGDISDPKIQEILNSKPWFVRKPETGARPMQFYLAPDMSAVNPLVVARPPMGQWNEMPAPGEKPQSGRW
ncbi:4Fe-4S dicluster domain-containing protein [Pyrobaculum ferrireducens]|nr:4Fe-4S dicluster domain-containing protein [Pyrobaculum ferrireducens]